MSEIIKTWHSLTEEDTQKAAEEFASIASAGICVGFAGQLGAGKTTFIRHLVAQWNIRNVTSPTFALVNVYHGTYPVYHFDFYRLNDEAELFEIGYYEYLEDGEALVLIEWADMFPGALPPQHWYINFVINEDGSRTISLARS
ncbi:MAG: tRNA (adenosine(37)-N6)-threonylcarbamoyltransferase complex ATPase subunit type 1 TsaE [Ignavibacteria bacterium]|nr:tRNA (adenosine(37)-N6)-threonylcarbamoyltransferase complex ATPase subunit type 1 TsaE [Ignavibacteria bacterium]